MTVTQKKIFSVFKIGLLALPAFFLLYLIKIWFWFLYPLPANGLEYATGFLLLFWLIGMWKLKFPRPVFSSKWQGYAVSFFLIAVSLATVAVVLHLDKGRATPLGIWKGWFMAPAVYFFMLISTFRRKADLRQLIDVTIGIMALSAAVMLIQFFTGWFSEITSTYDQRLVWPYLDPLSGKGASGNYPALYLTPFFCLAWGMLSKAQKHFDKGFYVICLIAMGLVVYFSKSYGAWLALTGACALTSFFMSTGKKRWVVVPLTTALVLAGMYADQRSSEKFQFAVDTSEEITISSGSERINIWKVSWDLIKRDPLWGVGPGQFQRAFERQAPFTLGREVSRKEINHALHPHNTFIMFWVSNGILGLLSYLFFLAVLIFPLPKEWRWILMAPIFSYLLHGMIDVTYWKNDLAFSFWFFAALMIIAQNLNLVSGKVQKGLQVGRELGFPTANIQLDIHLDKPHGVYAVILKIEKIRRKGLLYYGPRKTEGLPENIVCEITIFDFDEDIYDKNVTFKIKKFIRGPMNFSSKEELQEQIQKDVLVAKHLRFA
jgi:O-antigen ligase